MYDLIVKGGTVVDGSGLPGFRADVGIEKGIVTKIGDLKGERAKETLDAEGHIVAPGFIDGHTHMDAQIFWDPVGANSCWYGVTSVVMGNCGFTLAPCAAKDKSLVYSNLEMAEEISRPAMDAGIPWSWETFPEYMDAVEKTPKGLNYATYVGHSALRTYVMGQRAFTDKANADDLKGLTDQMRIAIKAGAVGLSTSRGGNHRTAEGKPVASRIGDWSEIEAMCQVMSDLGAGVYETARGITGLTPEVRATELAQLRDLAIKTKVPLTYGSIFYTRKVQNVWREQFAAIDEVVAAGGKIMLQARPNWNGSLRSFLTETAFDRYPIWSEFRKLPLEEQKKGLRNPELRRRLVDSVKSTQRSNDPSLPNFLLRDNEWEWVFPQDKILPPHRSIAQIAKERGIDPVEAFIDVALEHDLEIFFESPSNSEDPDYLLAVLRHPNSVPTFSDSGAHVTSSLNPIHPYLLGYWVRERQALTVEFAVRKMTFDLATFWGLKDRGLVREGLPADLCIFDLKTIQPQLPTLVHDIPTGAPRLSQKSDGIKATVVNGQILIRDNQHTGALPGKLLRNKLAQAH
jgi:N-acyl-D-amino-acid deacylase